jgi:hypothetical protein
MKTLLKILAAVVLVIIVAIGCIARGGSTMDNFSESAYEAALERFPGSSEAIDAGLEAFVEGYGNLAHTDLRARITELYAEDLYFNDTIHTYTSREDLVAYLGKTGDALDESIVEVRQVMRDGSDVFVRWSMDFKLRAVGREIHSRSIGVTHLRFNEDGQVLVHQDFWDSGHALYAKLPVVGWFIRRAHAQM